MRRADLALRDDTDADPENALETEKRLKEDFHPQGRRKSRHENWHKYCFLINKAGRQNQDTGRLNKTVFLKEVERRLLTVMPEWGTTNDGNHPHPSLPRRGGGNSVAASRHFDGKGGGIKGRGHFQINWP